MNKEQTKHVDNNSTILYGVPQVGYGTYHGCTPYPICLKACANYLGQDVDYDAIMVGTGAAFRLTWDMTSWNGGNVDVIFTFDDPAKVYHTGIEFLGRKCRLLGRTSAITKTEFIDFIKAEIDKGYPCIALGIIGPPETCILTGYRNAGETLLGWNFFQDNPEFGSSVTFDDSGYFISKDWWKNQDTKAVITLGEQSDTEFTLKEIIANAIEVLTGRKCEQFAKGILAYDYWKMAVSDDNQFSNHAIMPILVERLMCQGDAMDTLADGRSNASTYLQKLGKENLDYQNYLNDAAEQFGIVAANSCKMADLLGGWERGEKQMKAFAKPEIRKQIDALIDLCKAADEKALETLTVLYSKM